MDEEFVHPYIPNSVPRVKEEMLEAVGAGSIEELYSEMVPERLLLKRGLRLPDPVMGEAGLRRHMESLLSRNRDTGELTSFLGGGCWKHYVPKVCEVIQSRSEFLTAYAGGVYSDLGRFQANFEFQSLICELVGMEVSGLPTYDWGAAAGHSIRMAHRLTGRAEILVARNISPSRLSIIRNFCGSVEPQGGVKVVLVDFDRETGMVDLGDLEDKLGEDSAGVYFENPNYLGVVEREAAKVTELVHDAGGEAVVGVDPISLGVLAPPSEYGADIVCGEAQPLGVHMYAGGGCCGFIASRDEERYVAEYPLRLISIAPTVVEGEYGFGQALYSRTSYVARDKAKDWVGTTTVLWGITAAVYLSLLGPQGLREVGETILQRSHYAARLLSELEGVEAPYRWFFKEFPVSLPRPVGEVNQALLERGILGGVDLSGDYPELGQSMLVCVTEAIQAEDVRRLRDALREVLA